MKYIGEAVRDWHKLSCWMVNDAAVHVAGPSCASELSSRQSWKAVRSHTDCPFLSPRQSALRCRFGRQTNTHSRDCVAQLRGLFGHYDASCGIWLPYPNEGLLCPPRGNGYRGLSSPHAPGTGLSWEKRYCGYQHFRTRKWVFWT